jgi:2-oxoglutarate dehydrogenase E2 component (dihydrolipoamide succinyltransferase)
MPQMGESLSEGTVSKWLKKVGDPVKKDELLFEISTDKVDTEVPSPVSGRIEKILVQEGQTVEVGTVVATITAGIEKVTSRPDVVPTPVTSKTAGGSGHFKSVHKPKTFVRKTAPRSVGEKAQPNRFSPAVKSFAAEHQVPLSELARMDGSGAGGRVTKKDVLLYLEKREQSLPRGGDRELVRAETRISELPVPREPGALEVPAEYLYRPDSEDQLVPMSAIQKQMAEHRIWSRMLSAPVTAFAECNVHRIDEFLDKRGASFEEAEGVTLSLLPFVAEATVKAIKEFPIFNASILGDQIVKKKRIHLGIAEMLEEGVVAPVVRNADEMNLVGLARAIQRVEERPRGVAVSVKDLQGATFTITNPGSSGGLMVTPMIIQPQVAILAIGSVRKKPVVVEDAIAIRPVVALALTFDNRVIDNREGFSFIEKVRQNLEQVKLPIPHE